MTGRPAASPLPAALHRRRGPSLSSAEKNFILSAWERTAAYRGSRGSTSCAAGTGAFLDQQAARLGLPDAAGLAEHAMASNAPRPAIASRCSVFAKTDLIHAQQEGHSLEAICDGLCHGLARNVADTVFVGEPVAGPLFFCGGVARNPAVRRHLEAITGHTFTVPRDPDICGALGAALTFIDEPTLRKTRCRPLRITAWSDLIRDARRKETGTHSPLDLTLTDYPDFDGHDHFRHGGHDDPHLDVEVDLYLPPPAFLVAVLGLDIGSTSTKAVLTTAAGDEVVAGFYTRTTGRPLAAVQRILHAIHDTLTERGCTVDIAAAGTTGSGRKFIGRIIGADLVLDEITAHARAAIQLHPDVDTIIEIGGQDAKFTTLSAGRVTSATMNTVCAAGTGSFIEEQAAKLGCPLEAYATRTKGVQAPLSSDRCTVFMERDLNHYLTEGWSRDAVLASVLHAVRENYLLKVAAEGRIGNVILFQGATAKNPALVAAFEQRLGKPILVSRYCHLTGALGTALTLSEEGITASAFRGIGIWRKHIPVRSEVCTLCTNHCKLSVAEIDGVTEAYGFLCGRDYHTRRPVRADSDAFNLIAQRRKVFASPPCRGDTGRPVIGLPAAGYLLEDLPLWRFFFHRLGFPTVTSENLREGVRIGKPLTKAEFCAPLTALHGHVHHLESRCDRIFLPVYLEEKTGERSVRRQYCYYSQYAPVLASGARPAADTRILSPLVRYLYTGFHTRRELYRMFADLPGGRVSFRELTLALEEARAHQADCQKLLKAAWCRHLEGRPQEMRVVVLGRPYTVLSPSLNCGIPDLFHRMGVDCAFQDMLDPDDATVAPIRPLLDTLHWRYTASVLEAAQWIANATGFYPVLVTSFKCSPDAFILDSFKKIMTAADKPYLVLELDGHASNIGYETRIEAAVRAFRNHAGTVATRTPAVPRAAGVNPRLTRRETDRTLVLPNWDRLTGKLLEAVLRREGLHAILMQETEGTITRSLQRNTGQCIPVNAIVEGFCETLEQHRLAPDRAVLWMSEATIACNIAMYPHHMKTLLDARGEGMEKAGVYVGDLFFKDISPRAAYHSVFAFMFGGMLRRVACRLRPYERCAGETDRVVEEALETLYHAFLEGTGKQEALAAVAARFQAIPLQRGHAQRPKVAIFGDLYSRDNRIINQDLIRFIENHGGEVVTTPYTEYARMIANLYLRKWFFEKNYLGILSTRTLMAGISYMERKYYRYFQQILNEPMATYDDPSDAILSRFGIRQEHTGESLDNILKVHYLTKHHPDLTLFVQASPAFCCPSLVTEAMSDRIEEVTGVPVVPVTYDGTAAARNDVLIPYLRFPRSSGAVKTRPLTA
jgi:predicted CoA-substrate-specific enzyme activase